MFTCFSSEGIEATFLPNFNFYVAFLTKIARIPLLFQLFIRQLPLFRIKLNNLISHSQSLFFFTAGCCDQIYLIKFTHSK